jgi:hypothetical protein
MVDMQVAPLYREDDVLDGSHRFSCSSPCDCKSMLMPICPTRKQSIESQSGKISNISSSRQQSVKERPPMMPFRKKSIHASVNLDSRPVKPGRQSSIPTLLVGEEDDAYDEGTLADSFAL